MIDRILVPVDTLELENNLWAVESALEVSVSCRVGGESEIIFLHVLHSGSRVPMSESGKVHELKKERVEEEFKIIEEMCNSRGLSNYKAMIEEGEPAKRIIESAKEEKAGMIMMGVGEADEGCGSIAEKVIHEAPCTIFVARSTRARRDEVET